MRSRFIEDFLLGQWDVLPRIRPCPFCGSPKVRVGGTRDAAVECENCGVEGPSFAPPNDVGGAVEEAIQAWNRVAAAGTTLEPACFSFTVPGEPCSYWSSQAHIVPDTGQCRCGKQFVIVERS